MFYFDSDNLKVYKSVKMMHVSQLMLATRCNPMYNLTDSNLSTIDYSQNRIQTDLEII